MVKRTFLSKPWLVALVCLVLVTPSANAFARDHDRGRPPEPAKGRHDEHPKYDIGFFNPGRFWFEIVFARPKVECKTYTLSYIVVPEPKPAPLVFHNACAETITIYVPNSNGSYTSVTLAKYNGGYVGPQGEFYPGRPTIEQLRVLYAR
jgi:hypothetical protein